jgi:hypothetical protein
MSATVTDTRSETDWETYTPAHDSPQSMIQAWVRLYAKFRTHIMAVNKGRPQPLAHLSMYAICLYVVCHVVCGMSYVVYCMS